MGVEGGTRGPEDCPAAPDWCVGGLTLQQRREVLTMLCRGVRLQARGHYCPHRRPRKTVCLAHAGEHCTSRSTASFVARSLTLLTQLAAMRDLVKGAQPGDHFVFSCQSLHRTFNATAY